MYLFMNLDCIQCLNHIMRFSTPTFPTIVLHQWEKSCTDFVENATRYLELPETKATALIGSPTSRWTLFSGLQIVEVSAVADPSKTVVEVEGVNAKLQEKLVRSGKGEVWIVNRSQRSGAGAHLAVLTMLQRVKDDQWKRHDFVLPVILAVSDWKFYTSPSQWIERQAGFIPDTSQPLAVHPEIYRPLSELWKPDIFLVGKWEELQAAKRFLKMHAKGQYRHLLFFSEEGDPQLREEEVLLIEPLEGRAPSETTKIPHTAMPSGVTQTDRAVWPVGVSH